MKQQILNWLASPRNYLEGVELYKAYGHNKVLKNALSIGESSYNMDTLVYELSVIAGITETELKSIKRIAFVPAAKTETITEKQNLVPSFSFDDNEDLDVIVLKLARKLNITVEELENTTEFDQGEALNPVLVNVVEQYKQLPELQRAVINFRDKYDFLRADDCPNELKIMVTDMFVAYDKYRSEKALLSPELPDSENFQHASAAVESYLQNRMMWDELNYYKENGAVLGKHPLIAAIKEKEEIKAISDIDLPQFIKNASINVGKNKKAFEKATTDENKAKYLANTDKWIAKLALLTEELELRKK